MKKCIEIKEVEKVFNTEEGTEFVALKKVDLDIFENEFVSIIGPSGCGKSTMLRILSGLESSNKGEVFYRGVEHNRPIKEIGMVFQNYSLLPWRTVIDNIGLGLEFSKRKKSERIEISRKYLGMIGMSQFENSYPHELSGGMQQRVAIARALANDPDVLLMDEPFGALDAYTRIVLQRELLKIWQNNKKTVVFVTHSVDEAVYLSDKIVIMSSNPGKISEIVDVNMDRPRDRTDSRYVELSAYILNKLESLDSVNR